MHYPDSIHKQVSALVPTTLRTAHRQWHAQTVATLGANPRAHCGCYGGARAMLVRQEHPQVYATSVPLWWTRSGEGGDWMPLCRLTGDGGSHTLKALSEELFVTPDGVDAGTCTLWAAVLLSGDMYEGCSCATHCTPPPASARPPWRSRQPLVHQQVPRSDLHG